MCVFAQVHFQFEQKRQLQSVHRPNVIPANQIKNHHRNSFPAKLYIRHLMAPIILTEHVYLCYID